MKTTRKQSGRVTLQDTPKTTGDLYYDHDIDEVEWYEADNDGHYIQHPVFIGGTTFEFFDAPIIIFAKDGGKFIGVAYNNERFYERTGIAPTRPIEPEAKLPVDNEGEEWKQTE